MTLRTIQPNPYFYSILVPSWESFIPKKRKKVIRPFLRNQPLSEKLTMDGRTDRWRMTDNSALQKLRCHSAGGAKKLTKSEKSVRTLLRITHLTHRKSYWVFFCPSSHEKLTKSEIRSILSQFEHCSVSLVWSTGSPIWSLFAPIHMKIPFLSIFSLTYIYHYLPIFGPYL